MVAHNPPVEAANTQKAQKSQNAREATPMTIAKELLQLPVADLADKIRRRELSAVEVVDTFIERTRQVNPVLNALIADRFEQARVEAERADELVAATSDKQDLPPLLGVPFTAKEFISAKGFPYTAGLWARRNTVAETDATVITRAKDAGGIFLGVTNVPEGGMWMETHNKLFGRTNNPWDPRCTPGGSSGGEGALIGAAGVPWGIGGDVAGSIRIPAAFCGIAGHKPTGGVIPNTGQWQPDGNEMGGFLTTGPMARHASDLRLLFDLMRGPDGIDPNVKHWEEDAWSADDLSNVVVFPVAVNGATKVKPVMRDAVERSARVLAARGARLGELKSKRLQKAFAIWATAMSGAMSGENSPSFAEVLGDGEELSLAREFGRIVAGKGRVTIPALGLAALDKLAAMIPERLTDKVPKASELQAELEEELGPNGVLLHPPYTRPAPRHSRALLTPFDAMCTAVFNVIEFPVTQVPTGFDPHGLPVGVQVAARRGNDYLTMAVAEALEQEFGGWFIPPL